LQVDTWPCLCSAWAHTALLTVSTDRAFPEHIADSCFSVIRLGHVYHSPTQGQEGCGALLGQRIGQCLALFQVSAPLCIDRGELTSTLNSPYFFVGGEHADRNGGILLAIFSIAVSCTAITIKYTLKWQNRVMEKLDTEEKPYTGSLEGVPKGYRFIA
jgi:hypothetical protein